MRTAASRAVVAAATVLGGCDALPWEDGDGATSNPSAVVAPPGATPAAAPDEIPDELAATGLYADFATKTLAPASRAYAPAVPFWSDGYEKDRFIALPDGAKIDGANVDDWKFPVGTKVWKEIRSGQRKIETRFFWKTADDGWLQGSYVWSADGSQAKRGEGEDVVVDGKPYHVPGTSDCNGCHRGRKDKILGFEALSLAQPAATGLTLAVLAAENRIAPVPVRTTVTLSDPAFGVLHVNCGMTCHNATPGATAGLTRLRLRLGFEDVATKPPTEWEAFKTSVGVDARMPGWEGEVRVTPGAPEKSLLITVMKLRGEGQMPPIATNVVDAEGVTAVESWIRSLTR